MMKEKEIYSNANNGGLWIWAEDGKVKIHCYDDTIELKQEEARQQGGIMGILKTMSASELRVKTHELQAYRKAMEKHKIKKLRRQSGSRLNRHKRRRYAIDF